jgi:hypothetical protein
MTVWGSGFRQLSAAELYLLDGDGTTVPTFHGREVAFGHGQIPEPKPFRARRLLSARLSMSQRSECWLC